MKTNFALFLGNRGFFPGELLFSAREEMTRALERNGYGVLAPDASLTRFGGVETIEEGKLYAQFLREHRGEYDGIIVCLPNFGDENGAYYALKDADVPILVQAYPDEAGKMDFAHRRDALCGKIAMCNVLRQAGIRYTLTREFTVHPDDPSFAEDLRLFAGTCRVVRGMRSFNVGAIGARTTAFKTVRIDEIAMQKKRINVETIDLAQVFMRMENADAGKVEAKKKQYAALSDFGSYPPQKLENIARLGAAVDELIEAYDLQAVAIRCWDELEKQYGVAPCLILGELNERGICAACELDVNNAVMMRALHLAADFPVMLFDVNNNFGKDPGKVIFFHCGPAPASLMAGRGHIEEHLMFRKSYGEGSGVGINVGKIAPNEVTIGSFKTECGELWSFVTEGEITDDPIEKAFFGCGMVFRKREGTARDMLNYMAGEGYRHHVAITKGNWAQSVKEAFEKYLAIHIQSL